MRAREILVLTLAIILVLPGMLAFATNEGYGEDSEALGQFVDSFEDLNNISVRFQIERNATLNAMELNYTERICLYENFTTYTHTDPQNKVTPDNYNISWVDYERNDGGRTVYDFGVNEIDAFNYSFEFKISDLEGGDADTRGFLHVIMITQTDAVGWPADHYSLIQLIQVGASDTKYVWYLTTRDDGASDTVIGVIQLDVGIIYYINYFRNGLNKTLNVYTDSAMTNLVEHLSHNKGNDLFRYIQVIKINANANDGFDDSNGYMFELYNSSCFIGGYKTDGYFSTVDYLSNPLTNGSALVAMINTSIPANTQVLVEFSEDNSTWIFNDWQPIFGGFEAIDLRDLNYSTGFYIRYNLSTSNSAITPRIYQSRLITTIGNVSTIIQNVTGEWIEHNLTQIGVLVGTLDDGNLNSTLDIDGDTYNVSEVVGVPGFRISFNWTDIPDNADCIWIEIYYHYDGNQAHDVDVELWNFTSSSWVFLGHIVDSVDFVWLNVSIYDLRIPNDFVNSSGAVLGRINHADAGNMNHDLFIEYLKLQAFVPSDVAPTISGVNWGLLWFFLILICVPIALVLLKGSKR